MKYSVSNNKACVDISVSYISNYVKWYDRGFTGMHAAQ